MFLYIVIPKGFFPVQDTGVIQGISQAPQTISFAAMAQKQQELAKVILQDPAVREPFLVHRRRRHQHHAQQRPHVHQPEAAGGSAHTSAVGRDPQAAVQFAARCRASRLYMQPVQNITVDDRVSRTQYQYTLEDPDADELNDWTNRFVGKAEKLEGT